MSNGTEVTFKEFLNGLASIVLRHKFIILFTLIAGAVFGVYKSQQYTPVYRSAMTATSPTMPTKIVHSSIVKLEQLRSSENYVALAKSLKIDEESARKVASLRCVMVRLDAEEAKRRPETELYDFFEISFQYTGDFNIISEGIKGYIKGKSSLIPRYRHAKKLLIITDFEQIEQPINSRYSSIFFYTGIAFTACVLLVFFLELFRKSARRQEESTLILPE